MKIADALLLQQDLAQEINRLKSLAENQAWSYRMQRGAGEDDASRPGEQRPPQDRGDVGRRGAQDRVAAATGALRPVDEVRLERAADELERVAGLLQAVGARVPFQAQARVRDLIQSIEQDGGAPTV